MYYHSVLDWCYHTLLFYVVVLVCSSISSSFSISVTYRTYIFIVLRHSLILYFLPAHSLHLHRPPLLCPFYRSVRLSFALFFYVLSVFVFSVIVVVSLLLFSFFFLFCFLFPSSVVFLFLFFFLLRGPHRSPLSSYTPRFPARVASL